jgi:hypothetical protein
MFEDVRQVPAITGIIDEDVEVAKFMFCLRDETQAKFFGAQIAGNGDGFPAFGVMSRCSPGQVCVCVGWSFGKRVRGSVIGGTSPAACATFVADAGKESAASPAMVAALFNMERRLASMSPSMIASVAFAVFSVILVLPRK